MQFNYTGVNEDGDKVTGRIYAREKKHAIIRLSEKNIVIIKIEEGSDTQSRRHKVRQSIFSKSLSLDDFIVFSLQMKTLMHGGVSLNNAISGMTQFVSNPTFKAILKDVVSRIEAGFTMTDALSEHRDYIPPVMLGIIQAGEMTGDLEGAFERLARYFEKEKDTRQKISNVIRYPIIVSIVSVVAMLVMNTVVIPTFSGVFDHYGAELPLLTRILIESSNFIIGNMEMITVLAGLAFLWVRHYLRTAEGRFLWDSWKLRLPLFGPLIHQAILGRLCYAISMLFSSRIPIVEGLTVAAGTTGNAYFEKKVKQLANDLERGMSLTTASSSSGLFHPLAMQMMSAGETTGRLDDTMARVAYYYDKQIDQEIKQISERFEPIVLIAVGIVVLVLALGIFVPLWDMSAVMTGGA